ncbi:18530_t:CDS:1, partial [Funneliformis geosporum]
ILMTDLRKQTYPQFMSFIVFLEERFHKRIIIMPKMCGRNLNAKHNDLYLKIDVFSLADVWTIFRKTFMHHYGLDPSHYISASSLSWDAMLKITKVKIKLFTEMAMYDFIEKAK